MTELDADLDTGLDAGLDAVGTMLLTAARDLLASEGAGALTVRRIAKSAGMSTINVYSRFGGKDGVVERLYVDGFRLLARAMDEAGTSDDPIDDLRRCGQAYRRFALAHTTLYGVMFDRVVPDFEPSPAAARVAAGTLDTLAQRVDAAMRAGGRTPPHDPLQAAAIVWATCHGVMSLESKHAGPDAFDWAQIFTDACTAVLVGLGIGGVQP